MQADSASNDSSPPIDASSCASDDAGTSHLASFLQGPVPGVTASFAAIESLAADASAVYVSLLVSDDAPDGSVQESIDVVRVPLDCGAPTLLASKPGQNDVWRSVLAGDRLYLEMTDGIYSLPASGGALTLEAATQPLIGGMGNTFAVAGETLAWIDASGALWTVATGGGDTPRALANAPAPDAWLGGWTSIAMDSASVYATAEPIASGGGDAGSGADAGDGGSGDGSVVAIPLAGGAATVLAVGQQRPGELMVSGATLYWANSFPIPTVDTASSHGPILSLALPNGAPTIVATDEIGPEQLTMRGSTLIWVNNGGPDGGDAIHMLSGGAETKVPLPLVIGLEGLTLGPRGAYWGAQDLYGFAF